MQLSIACLAQMFVMLSSKSEDIVGMVLFGAAVALLM